ncbi:MAG: Ig-like domain-containing protein, partial [Puniceicoccaceae bacterium]
MKMNRIAFLPAVLLLQSCMLAEQLPRQITLRVVDPSGNPVPGAFAAGYSSNKGGGGEGVTNDEGEITVTARRDFAFWVRSSKEGYYNTMGSIGWPPPDPMDIVLKRKIDPVPMVVGEVPG